MCVLGIITSLEVAPSIDPMTTGYWVLTITDTGFGLNITHKFMHRQST